MPDDKNLRDTLAEVAAETQEPADTQGGETEEELSGGEEKTTSGEISEPEYVSGVDISGIPEAERAIARKVLQEKAGLLEKGYQGKFKDVADLKKMRDSLESLGITQDEAQKALMEYIYKKQNPTPADSQKAQKLLDKLAQTVPPEQRENLRQFREIIAEETNAGELKKEIDNLKKTISILTQGAVSTRSEKLSSELEGLAATYGKELIEKARHAILREGVKYPTAPAKALLFAMFPDDVERALSAKKQKQITTEKANAISSAPSGLTSAEERIDVKTTSLKDLVMKLREKK